jgi:hypothetical protein
LEFLLYADKDLYLINRSATGSTSTDVFLFYDGYELRAEEDLRNRLSEEVRRGARFIYKKLRRRDPRTGFYTWFLMLCRALNSVGCRVHVNDFAAARRSPQQPIGAAGYPTILEKLKVLPNPRLIGPGLYSSPLENPNLFGDPRNVIFLQTCEWYENMFRPWYGDRMRLWFGGFDVADFPDGRSALKKWDVLIYDKINFDRDIYYSQTVERFRKMLDELRLSYKIIRYGNYTYQEYLKSVRSSRCMAFFAHSETQGTAYQECLASNVPVFTWNEGIWPNPDAKELGRGPIYCTNGFYSGRGAPAGAAGEGQRSGPAASGDCCGARWRIAGRGRQGRRDGPADASRLDDPVQRARA